MPEPTGHEHGRGSGERGFTLLELLVAWGSSPSSVRWRWGVERHRRPGNQATHRLNAWRPCNGPSSVTNDFGSAMPARQDEWARRQGMPLVADGRTITDSADSQWVGPIPQPSTSRTLQRVQYRLEDGTDQRVCCPRSSPGAEPRTEELLTGVEEVKLLFLTPARQPANGRQQCRPYAMQHRHRRSAASRSGTLELEDWGTIERLIEVAMKPTRQAGSRHCRTNRILVVAIATVLAVTCLADQRRPAEDRNPAASGPARQYDVGWREFAKFGLVRISATTGPAETTPLRERAKPLVFDVEPGSSKATS